MSDDSEESKPVDGEIEAKAGDEADPSAGDVPVVSLSIWPPSQRSRDAVIQRLVKTLSTPSLMNKRYSLFPVGDASPLARRIEEEAFAVAQDNGVPATDDEGIEFLHLYSKEISKRIMEAITSGAWSASSAPSAVTPEDDAGMAKSTASDSVSDITQVEEDDSSVQKETA